METEAGPEEREGLQREPLDWNFPGSDILEGDLGRRVGRCMVGNEGVGEWVGGFSKFKRQVHLWCIINVH